MKTFKYILTVFVLTFIVLACKNETELETKSVEMETPQQKKALNPDADYATLSFEVEGMKCALGCARVIEKNLLAMEGVKDAQVDFDSKMATVTYDSDLVDREILENTVTTTSDTYKITAWQNIETPVVEKE